MILLINLWLQCLFHDKEIRSWRCVLSVSDLGHSGPGKGRNITRTAKNKIIKKKRTTRQETLFITLFIILSMYMYLSIRINFLIVIKIYSFVLTYINNFIENCIPVEKSK